MSTPVNTSLGGGSVFILRQAAPSSAAGQIRTPSGARILTVAPTDSALRIGTASPAGGIILRGNQLIRLPRPGGPTAGGGYLNMESSRVASKSPVKVQLISASSLMRQQQQVGGVRPQALSIRPGNASPGLAKPTMQGGQHATTPTVGQGGVMIKSQLGPGQNQMTGGGEIGDVKPKIPQYRFLLPSNQAGQQETGRMVSSQGVTVKNIGGTHVVSAKAILSGGGAPVSVGGETQMVYCGANASISNSGTATDTFQTIGSAGIPTVKKGRPYNVPGARKPCNCTKSQCLKLYCDCFANGEFCRNCNCNNCRNNLAYESERSKAIKSCLERNPLAFQPKIGKGRADTDRLHNKGCNCKKSSCLKNYCECYEAKVACTHRCKCSGCRNTDADRTHRHHHHHHRSSGMGAFGLHNLANIAASLHAAPMTDYRRAESPDSDESTDKPDPKRMPWYYMTDDVVEATALCLVAKTEQMESKSIFDETDMQRAVLKEFGRCLQQIIYSASG